MLNEIGNHSRSFGTPVACPIRFPFAKTVSVPSVAVAPPPPWGAKRGGSPADRTEKVVRPRTGGGAAERPAEGGPPRRNARGMLGLFARQRVTSARGDSSSCELRSRRDDRDQRGQGQDDRRKPASRGRLDRYLVCRELRAHRRTAEQPPIRIREGGDPGDR